MVDSYVLHIISRINYAKSIPQHNRELEAQLSENDMMRKRSIYYTANPYIKK